MLDDDDDRRARARVEVGLAIVCLVVLVIVLQRWTSPEPPQEPSAELPQLPWNTWIDSVLDEDGRGSLGD